MKSATRSFLLLSLLGVSVGAGAGCASTENAKKADDPAPSPADDGSDPAPADGAPEATEQDASPASEDQTPQPTDEGWLAVQGHAHSLEIDLPATTLQKVSEERSQTVDLIVEGEQGPFTVWVMAADGFDAKDFAGFRADALDMYAAAIDAEEERANSFTIDSSFNPEPHRQYRTQTIVKTETGNLYQCWYSGASVTARDAASNICRTLREAN